MTQNCVWNLPPTTSRNFNEIRVTRLMGPSPSRRPSVQRRLLYMSTGECSASLLILSCMAKCQMNGPQVCRQWTTDEGVIASNGSRPCNLDKAPRGRKFIGDERREASVRMKRYWASRRKALHD